MCAISLTLAVILLANLIWEIAAQFDDEQPLSGHYDFFAFYSGASLVIRNQASNLYNPQALLSLQRLLIPQAIGAQGYMPFLNPPFVAALQAPLALFSEPVARFLWFAVNSGLAVFITWSLTRSMPGRYRRLGYVAMLGAVPVYQTLIDGQWSLVILLGCLVALKAARGDRPMVAGAGLATLWLKPQLGVLVVIGLVAFRCWRPLAAMLGMLALVVLATAPLIGVRAYLLYPGFVLGVLGDHFNGATGVGPVAWQGALALTEGINGLVVGALGTTSAWTNDILLALGSAVTLLIYGFGLRRARPGFGNTRQELMLLATLALVLLLDPHLFPQDLTLAFLAVPLLAPRMRDPSLAIVGLCVLVDFAMLDEVYPVHLFTIVTWLALVGCCLAVYRASPTTGMDDVMQPVSAG